MLELKTIRKTIKDGFNDKMEILTRFHLTPRATLPHRVRQTVPDRKHHRQVTGRPLI